MIIAFDGLELSYTEEETERIIQLWKENKSLIEIADEVRPKKWGWKKAGHGMWEIYIILGDLARLGQLPPRKEGIFAGLENTKTTADSATTTTD